MIKKGTVRWEGRWQWASESEGNEGGKSHVTSDIWPSLAPTYLIFRPEFVFVLASTGLAWPSLTWLGLAWSSLAYPCLDWPSLSLTWFTLA